MNDIKLISTFSKTFKAIDIIKKILIGICMIIVLFKLMRIKKKRAKLKSLFN